MYHGPETYALADWRRRVNDLYAEIRRSPDPQEAWRHWQLSRAELFRSHPMSPLPEADRGGYDNIPVFPYDPTLRFAVDLVPVDGMALTSQIGADGQLAYHPIARTAGLDGRLGGELTVYWIDGYGGGLFLPFKDATCGSESYGGGRYAIDAIKGSDLGLDEDGRLIVDFNFAYNPSCAISDAYVYPLAPPENTLPAPVRAGERLPLTG